MVFVALHGGDGEDGTVQELLEALGLRYTGSRPAACVRSWDKVLAKELLREAGVPTPDDLVFSESAVKELGAADALDVVEERLGFPVVVKPACQGSALGVRFAASAAEVPGALIAAFSYSEKVLVERYVDGRELAVSLLGDEPLPVVEAEPHEEDFYDFEARYTIGRTTFHCPAELDGASRPRRRSSPSAPRRRSGSAASRAWTCCWTAPAASPTCSRRTRSPA